MRRCGDILCKEHSSSSAAMSGGGGGSNNGGVPGTGPPGTGSGTELQATIELSLEFHKFYNVDLFQRG